MTEGEMVGWYHRLDRHASSRAEGLLFLHGLESKMHNFVSIHFDYLRIVKLFCIQWIHVILHLPKPIKGLPW